MAKIIFLTHLGSEDESQGWTETKQIITYSSLQYEMGGGNCIFSVVYVGLWTLNVPYFITRRHNNDSLEQENVSNRLMAFQSCLWENVYIGTIIYWTTGWNMSWTSNLITVVLKIHLEVFHQHIRRLHMIIYSIRDTKVQTESDAFSHCLTAKGKCKYPKMCCKFVT